MVQKVHGACAHEMPHFRHGHRQSFYDFNHLNQIHFEFDLNVDDVSLKSVRVASTLPGPHDYRSVWWLSRLLVMWELVACAKSVRNVTSRRSHIHMSERCIGSPVPYEATVQPARGTDPGTGGKYRVAGECGLSLTRYLPTRVDAVIFFIFFLSVLFCSPFVVFHASVKPGSRPLPFFMI